MKLFRPFLLLAALQLAAAGTVAAAEGLPPSSGLHWRCWYDERVHIVCLIDTMAEVQPLDSLPYHLPAIVQQLRNNPEAFRNVFVRIPLFSPPFQAEFTAQLARATVCGTRHDCTVDFTMRPPSAEEVQVLLEKNRLPGEEEEGVGKALFDDGD